MNLQQRHNVRVVGSGPATIVFAHGFGCDQTMWRLLAPGFQRRFQTILFDLVGSGGSHLPAYDFDRHASLQGQVDDGIDIVLEFATKPVIF